MRRNLLLLNAPGETRTPNLLIRSQSHGLGTRGSARQHAPEAATERPKSDSGSHNISHNTRIVA
jgi:hypothetical protein